MVTLETVLAEAQRIGLIGPGSLLAAIEQGDRFAASVPVSASGVVDIGSGGGLPGLVIRARRPDVSLVLVDRRQRACDFLRRSVEALGWASTVQVVEADVASVSGVNGGLGQCDVVTARGFGPPGLVAELALPLLRPGGLLIVSAVGAGESWPTDGVALFGAQVLSRENGLVLVEAGLCPPHFPRSRRSPLMF